AIQQALYEEPWPLETPLRVRAALHTGEADLRAIAHGGQTLLSQATYDLVRDALPDGVSLRDLGEHRLSDLARPEQVYPLVAPGVPGEFAPLRSLDALPHNLPLQVTSFVGRERELATVRELLS